MKDLLIVNGRVVDPANNIDAERDVLVSSILVQHQTLEDRFLALTGKALR